MKTHYLYQTITAGILALALTACEFDENDGFGDFGNFGAANATAPASVLYFSANDGVSGSELWVTDGTEANTRLVADMSEGFGSSNPTSFNPLPNNRVLYRTSTFGGIPGRASIGGDISSQWHVSDGSVEGTAAVGTSSWANWDVATLNGTTYFQAYDGISGYELFATDGTPTGTALAIDIDQTINSSYPTHLSVFNNALYFGATADIDNELWSSDGTAQNTAIVNNWNLSGSTSPNNMTVLGSKLLFSCFDAASDRELCVYDGQDITAININPYGASYPYTFNHASPEFLTTSTHAYFMANADGINSTLHRTDGTANGTQSLNIAGHIQAITVIPGEADGIVMTYYDYASFTYRTAIIRNGVVTDMEDLSGSYIQHIGFSNDGKLIAWGFDAIGQRNDILLVDVDQNSYAALGTVLNSAGNMTGYEKSASFGDGRFLISGYTTEFGAEPWVTDGTLSGTYMVKDIWSGATGSTGGFGDN